MAKARAVVTSYDALFRSTESSRSLWSQYEDRNPDQECDAVPGRASWLTHSPRRRPRALVAAPRPSVPVAAPAERLSPPVRQEDGRRQDPHPTSHPQQQQDRRQAYRVPQETDSFL